MGLFVHMCESAKGIVRGGVEEVWRTLLLEADVDVAICLDTQTAFPQNQHFSKIKFYARAYFSCTISAKSKKKYF